MFQGFSSCPKSLRVNSFLIVAIPYVAQESDGLPKYLVCISSYMPRLENSAGLSHPRHLTDDIVLPSAHVITLQRSS